MSRQLSVITIAVVAGMLFSCCRLSFAGSAADTNSPVRAASAPNEPAQFDENRSSTGPGEPNSTGAVPKRVEFNRKCAYILGQVVSDDGLVNYGALKFKRVHVSALLYELETLDREEYNSWTKSEQMAFWINAYNIQKLWLIMNNFPIDSSRWDRFWNWPPHSIQHIDKNVGGIDVQKFIIMDEEFTFREIDRRLRTDFDDPRVFFALCWAARSGPPLRPEPYYGYKLDKQLEGQVRRFLSSPLAFHIDRDKKKVEISYLFSPNMYGKVFGRKYATDRKFKDHPPEVRAVLNFISGYISEYDKNFLETEAYSVEEIVFDWTINDINQRHR